MIEIKNKLIVLGHEVTLPHNRDIYVKQTGQIETRLKADFAHVLNKNIYCINTIPERIYTEELVARKPIILEGDIR